MLFKVEKMICNHCIRAITDAIQTLDAQARVEADLAKGTVRVTGEVKAEDAVSAMQSEGYPARLIAD
jgi:copper chaperone